MEVSLSLVRGTNQYRVEVWEDDYLRQTPFRLECYRVGWIVSGCPILAMDRFDNRNKALEALKLVIGAFGIVDAQRRKR